MATVTATLTPKPLFLQAVGGDTAISYTSEDFRNLTGAIWPRAGLLGALSFRIYQRLAGANWSVDINGGFAVLGNTVSEVDRYLAVNDARVNVALTGFNTAPAATRTHRVFVAVYDKSIVGTEYLAKIVVTEDTGSGAPVPADNPAYYFEVGTFVIAPGQSNIATANITNSGGRAEYGYSPIDLALSGGILSAAGSTNSGPPRYSIAGSTIKLQGGVTHTTGSFAQGTVYSIAVLPDGYRPKYERYCAGVGHNASPWRATVGTNGLIQASFAPSGASTLQWLGLDGITFQMD